MSYQEAGRCPQRPMLSCHLEPSPPRPTPSQPPLQAGQVALLSHPPQYQCCWGRMKAEKWRTDVCWSLAA